ncbi:MAG: outer membrane cobalamin receptor, partial [Maribacter sp.]
MKIKHSHYFLLVLFLCFSCNLLFAQGMIEGIVTGDDAPEGLISAQISSNGVGTVTEFDGSYSLSLPAGTHTIIYSYTGYENHKETITLADGEARKLDVEMIVATNLLKQATVTSGKFDKPLGEVTVSIEIIKPALAEATNSTTIDQVLDRVPGVTMVDGQANIRGGSGFSYGAGSRVLLLVDDIPILSGDAGYPSWSDVPVENISQVEVVKGAASALYGSSALNGIINIRTAYAKSKPETQVSVYSDIFTAPKDSAKKWWAEDSITRPYKVGFSVVHRRKVKKLDVVVGTNIFKEIDYTQYADDRKIRLNAKLRYRITEKLNIGIYANYNYGKSNTVFLWENNAEGAYSGDSSMITNATVKRYNVDPFVNYTDKYSNKHRYIGRYFLSSNDNSNDQGNRSDNFYNEYQFQRKFKKAGIVLTTGLVGMNSIATGSLYGDFRFKSTNAAIYLQSEKKFYLSKNEDGSNNEEKNVLNLTFGARYEYNKLLGPDTVFIVPGSTDLFEVIEGGKFEEARPIFRVGAS